MFNIRKSSFFTYFLFIPLILVYHLFEDIKQVFYILPVPVIISMLVFQFFKTQQEALVLDRNMIQALLLYMLICGASLFFAPDDIYWFTAWRDMIIISSPFFIFCFMVRYSHQNIIWLMVTSFVGYLIWIKFKIDLVFLKSLLVSNFSWRNEYDYGTITGIFIIYFLYKKDYKMLGLAIVFLLFVNKRGTFLGLLPAIIAFYGIIKFFHIDNNKWALFGFLFLYYMFFYVFSINLPLIASTFLEIMERKDIDIDRFLTGRVVMIRELTPEIYGRGWLNYLFGNGPGQADFYLWKVIKHPIYNFYIRPINPHNDFLKLHFDIGLIGVVVYFLIMYYMYCVSEIGILIFLFVVPLFLIENTLIYYINLLLCCVVVRADENTKEVLK
jgi:hypothetical protein